MPDVADRDGLRFAPLTCGTSIGTGANRGDPKRHEERQMLQPDPCARMPAKIGNPMQREAEWHPRRLQPCIQPPAGTAGPRQIAAARALRRQPVHGIEEAVTLCPRAGRQIVSRRFF